MTNTPIETVDSTPSSVSQILGMAEEKVEFPLPPENFDGTVKLFVPLKTDQDVIHTVQVRELTGAHEEKLARYNKLTNLARWEQAALECGIEGLSPSQIEQLTVGDRDNILVAIRKATYGSDIDYGLIKCEQCSEEYEVSIDLDEDLEIRGLEGSDSFDVPLRKGGSAQVHLPTGADHIAVFDNPEANEAERKSILLARCVDALTDAQGNQTLTAGFGSITKNLSVPDRTAIMLEINKRQPGPQFLSVHYKHECGYDQFLPVSLMLLFPGL